MTYTNVRKYAQWIAFPIWFASCAHASSATIKDILPPPGLYQVDSDTTITRAEQQFELKLHRDGATGAEHEQTSIQGKVSSKNTPGTGRVTECLTTYGPSNVSGLAAPAQCSKQSQKIVGDKTLVHTAQCPDSQFTMEVTKIDDKHWQYITRTETAKMGATAGAGGMEAMLKLRAQYGNTPRDRAEAAKALAALPSQKSEFDHKRASDLQDLQESLAKEKDPQARAFLQRSIASMGGASAPGGSVKDVNVAKERWTRIADSCGSAQPAH